MVLNPDEKKKFDVMMREKLGERVEMPSIAHLRGQMMKRQTLVTDTFKPSDNFFELKKPPMLMLPFPEGETVFNVFFDLKLNAWVTWDSAMSEFNLEQLF